MSVRSALRALYQIALRIQKIVSMFVVMVLELVMKSVTTATPATVMAARVTDLALKLVGPVIMAQ